MDAPRRGEREPVHGPRPRLYRGGTRHASRQHSAEPLSLTRVRRDHGFRSPDALNRAATSTSAAAASVATEAQNTATRASAVHGESRTPRNARAPSSTSPAAISRIGGSVHPARTHSTVSP